MPSDDLLSHYQRDLKLIEQWKWNGQHYEKTCNAWLDQQDQNWRELYHYFVLDLPSMAWSIGLRDLAGKPLAEQLGLEPETSDPLKHTGITGAESNVEVYRAILARRQQQ